MRLRQQTVPVEHKNKQHQDSAGMFSLQAGTDVLLSLVDKEALCFATGEESFGKSKGIPHIFLL